MNQNTTEFDQLQSFVTSNLVDHQNLQLNFALLADEQNEVNQLSDGLAGCINLVDLKLFLRSSFIEKQNLTKIFSALIKCQSLTTLNVNLDGNLICDEGASALGLILSKCSNLTSLILELYRNQIKIKGANSLYSGISKCSKLVNLEIYLAFQQAEQILTEESHDQINQNTKDSLDFDLTQITNLTQLAIDFRYLKIGDEGLYQLGLILSQCKNMECLKMYIDQNGFSEECLPSFFIALSKCVKLTHLTLYMTLESCCQQSAFKVGQTISEQLNTQFLELWFQGDGNLQNLISGLSSSNSLLSLYLWLDEQSVLEDKYIQNIADALLKYKNLKNIKLLFYQEEKYEQQIKKLFVKLRKLKRLINFDIEIV
ncbi:hypothetical protein TTHERM_01546850 (macronuclear) [Tetrahymena thermophila SB210]|uniref:Kinase domain protein n=1 Tax=Tetrahymena thermophila (strain SB210) TaxID=312017 RepID=Q228K3_TETTS|nr:hypothetical protein TTHERM_01546850 [Tetrahymena thermophila SB210]EAR81719.2 hypothetical protein TTHERM_01546850 [Tetrahymena thermophila SB210]|eukprot:XP_001029382.2 hypothetical protein TTHERM_01546850 [Tetrahymena thermophila SB210]